MSARELEGYRVHECARCHGFFVDDLTLKRLEQSDGPAPGQPTGPVPKASRPTSPVVYIRCPGCADVMNRVQFGRGSGIVVDVCKQHGTFFDAEELERARAFVAGGGLEESRKRTAQDEADRAASARRRSRRKERADTAIGPTVTSEVAIIAVARAIARWLGRS